MYLDSQLQQAVITELRWDPSITDAGIAVSASGGVVTLTGHVETFAEKQAAETAALRVKGVRGVAEDIEVQLPFERVRGDNDIAAAALERLAWDTSVPPDAIIVRVEHGWITLTGDVASHYQKDAAEQDVRRLHGVVGLSNHIAVKSVQAERDTRDAIIASLDRAWLSDGHTIQVTAEKGQVLLTGQVYSPHDRLTAATIAWGAPGTTSVQNDITIL